MMRRIILLALAILLPTAGLARAAPWVPPPGTTFEWILQNYAGTTPAAKVIDVDLFDTPASRVAKQLKLSPLLKRRSLTAWSRRCP